jgi:hypothetical protein
LARVITDLLKAPAERERLADLACARARLLFTEDRFIKAYADTYLSLHASRKDDAAGVAVSAA